MGVGYLIIQARTAGQASPLANVQLRITGEAGEELYTLQTDESGSAGPISLYAVDRNLSQTPDYTGNPYSIYDLEASAAGYESLYIRGIHIFDGETAMQPLELVPLRTLRGTAPTQTITIGPHAVQQSDTRNQRGMTIAPRIFSQVFIPDPITVHLGAPASAAGNVEVRFTDYIKNVASCEIYPTWPVAALEANIYAIITFALNRVFTEWYRSRGYDFDITNSTAYDMSYQYGHTIYESISRIVDEIFNEYIRRAGRLEPYFSSFCNGSTVTCSGLSQWGTVTLANQGQAPLQILRNYYPDDIEISEANIVSDVTQSYPGTAFRRGSSGGDVERIQTLLDRIRRNYPAIPAITDAPGVFGGSTEAAVRAFQQIFDLTADGIVGRATWNKLSAIYTAVTRLGEQDSEGIPVTEPDFQYIVRSGDSLWRLAQRFDTTIDEIKRRSGITNDALLVGQVLRIPGSIFAYTVQPGDSLWLIAKRYNLTVDLIKRLNNLSGDGIYAGQILYLTS